MDQRDRLVKVTIVINEDGTCRCTRERKPGSGGESAECASLECAFDFIRAHDIKAVDTSEDE